MKNNQKGITLIALVVTIIVLLILAGVSIAMVAGEGGILSRAKDAGWKSKLSSAEDVVGLYVSNYITDFYSTEYTGVDKSEFNDAGTPFTSLAAAVTKALEDVQTAVNEQDVQVTSTNITATEIKADAVITLTFEPAGSNTHTVKGKLIAFYIS